jgi:maltose phosphorylase
MANFRRELNMKEGWYHRSLKLLYKTELNRSKHSSFFIFKSWRIRVVIMKFSTRMQNIYKPITNEDANWEENFGNLR